MMKDKKRIDKVNSNFYINLAMLDTNFKSILCGGAWGAKTKMVIRENYFMSPDQFRKLKAPSLKGTKLKMAIKGLEFCGLSCTLNRIHVQVRTVAKSGLKEYQIFMINKKGWQEWDSIKTRDDNNNVMAKFLLTSIQDIQLNEEGDDGPRIRKLAKAMMNGIKEALTQPG